MNFMLLILGHRVLRPLCSRCTAGFVRGDGLVIIAVRLGLEALHASSLDTTPDSKLLLLERNGSGLLFLLQLKRLQLEVHLRILGVLKGLPPGPSAAS